VALVRSAAAGVVLNLDDAQRLGRSVAIALCDAGAVRSAV